MTSSRSPRTGSFGVRGQESSEFRTLTEYRTTLSPRANSQGDAVRHDRRPSMGVASPSSRSRPTSIPPPYERRRPEAGLLHSVVRDHLPAFFSALEDAGTRLPTNVRRELNEYLRCGILAHGFIRGECERCR